MANVNILDLAKRQGSDAVVGLIEENLAVAPEIAEIPARVIAATSYKTLMRTALPSFGFRSVNEGVTASKSTYGVKTVEMFVGSSRLVVDKAFAAGGDLAQLQADEASGVTEAAFRAIGSQVFYGTSADAKGFAGFQATVHSDLTESAGGSTAKTSAYAVRFGNQGVNFIFGNNGTLDLGAWREGDGFDASGKAFPAWIADLCTWIGLQCVNKYALARISNIGTDAGKGLTDALIAAMLVRWRGPAPDAIFVNRRSLSQLQISRSVTLLGNATGASQPFAPVPTHSNGIRLVTTDSLVNSES